MSGPEILLILVAVFAVGRLVAVWRDSGPGRTFRPRADSRRLVAAALFIMAGVYGCFGLAWAFRWGLSLAGPPRRGVPGPPEMAMTSGVCLLVTWFLIWLGVRVGRGGGLPGRFARAARAACREFFAPADAGAKPKPDPASRLLD